MPAYVSGLDKVNLPGQPHRAPTSGSRQAPTPFHTIEWTRAWCNVTTEQVTDHRLMQWPLKDGGSDHLPFYRVAASPLWTALEGDAELDEPVWPGPVTYARSLYGVYGGLPDAPTGVLAEAVDEGRELARQWDTPALVVSNLTDEEAQRWTAVRQPDATVGLYWTHRVELRPTVDEFVTADQRRRKRRRNLRSQWNRGNELGLHAQILHGRDMLPVLPDIVPHARATSERHGPPLYGLDMLAPLVDVPGAFTVIADHPRGLAGALIGFHHGDTVYLWTAAVDQARKKALHTYAWLMYTSIAYACTVGATTLDTGRGNYKYKAQLGLTASPLSCLIYLTRPDQALTERLADMHRGLDSHAHRAWARTRGAVG